MTSRITVVDDEAEVRDALVAMLEGSGFSVTSLSSLEEFVSAAKARRLGDLALVDADLDGEPAFESMRVARRVAPETVLMAISGHASPEWVLLALQSGCAGYVLKSEPDEAIIRAAHAALDGESPLSARVAREVLRATMPTPPAPAHLSARELAALREVAEGSPLDGRGEDAIQRAMSKLDARTQAEAIARAITLGMLKPRQS